MRRISIVVSLVVPSLLVAACASSESEADLDTSSSRKVEVVSGSSWLPNQQVGDWVTYADHVLVARVAASNKGGLHSREGEIIPRRVTLEVQKVLWSRAESAKAPPASMEWAASGWIIREGGLRPFSVADAPRLEQGHD